MSWMPWIFVGLVVLTIVSFLMYEFTALVNQQRGDTISEIIWYVTAKYPLVPFLAGFVGGMLAGHFWWQRAP